MRLAALQACSRSDDPKDQQKIGEPTQAAICLECNRNRIDGLADAVHAEDGPADQPFRRNEGDD